jgi:hypothetical protein
MLISFRGIGEVRFNHFSPNRSTAPSGKSFRNGISRGRLFSFIRGAEKELSR